MAVLLEDSEFRANLRAEKAKSTYAALERKYGVNQFYLWNMIRRDDYIPPPKVAAALGITVLRLAPACAQCGEVHTIDGVCTARKLVQVIVSEPADYEQLLQPVKIVVRRARPKQNRTPRASINLEDPASAAKTIRKKMGAEAVARLAELLKE